MVRNGDSKALFGISKRCFYTPGPYTHWRFLSDGNSIRHSAVPGGCSWVEVLLRCLCNRNKTQQYEQF